MMTVALLVLVGLVLALAPPAQARTYVHAPCRGYSGSSVGDRGVGWKAAVPPGYGRAHNGCERGNTELLVEMSNTVDVPQWANLAWDFRAPEDTKVVHFKGSWAGWARPIDARGGGILHILGDGFSLGEHVNYTGTDPKPFDVKGLSAEYLNFHVGCYSMTVCPADGWGFGWMAVFDPVVVLSDGRAPQVVQASGSAIADARWEGVKTLHATVTDRGGGIQSLRLYVDQQLKQEFVPDDNDGRCRPGDHGEDGAHYGSVLPCPSMVTAAMNIDTNAIPDGQHEIALVARDVAGNEQTIHRAVKAVANHPPRNVAAPEWLDAQGAHSPVVGRVLGAHDGTWSGPALTITRTWQRCSPAGDACVSIPGATTTSYLPLPADVGKRLRFVVTASNPGGSVTLATPLTGVVKALPSSAVAAQAAVPGLPVYEVGPDTPHLFLGRVVGEPAGATCPEDKATLRFVGVSGGRVTLAHGRARTVKVKLTCTRNGRAIADARIDVAAQTGNRPAEVSRVTTNGSGEASVRLEKGPSRLVAVGYRMYADEPVARVYATLDVVVRGKVALRPSRTRLRNGQAVTLRGRLYGGHVPRRGVTLAVQWRDGKRWRPFAQITTNRQGTFRYAYRFTRTSRPVVYHLRVQMTKGQIDYPFAPVASRPVRIVVGP
jgi:hypothetical protein